MDCISFKLDKKNTFINVVFLVLSNNVTIQFLKAARYIFYPKQICFSVLADTCKTRHKNIFKGFLNKFSCMS